MYRLVFITITILITVKTFSKTSYTDEEPYAGTRFNSSDKGDYPTDDKGQTVSYNAIVLIGRDPRNTSNQEMDPEVSFTKDEINQLFSIARNSIHKMLFENKRLAFEPSKISPNLKKNMGAFVTLNINGNLRGCIGRFTSADPLYEVVNQMAIAAAFEDTRFSPISNDEFSKLKIEISVLGPLK